jgi:hypothetical protein
VRSRFLFYALLFLFGTATYTASAAVRIIEINIRENDFNYNTGSAATRFLRRKTSCRPVQSVDA